MGRSKSRSQPQFKELRSALVCALKEEGLAKQADHYAGVLISKGNTTSGDLAEVTGDYLYDCAGVSGDHCCEVADAANKVAEQLSGTGIAQEERARSATAGIGASTEAQSAHLGVSSSLETAELAHEMGNLTRSGGNRQQREQQVGRAVSVRQSQVSAATFQDKAAPREAGESVSGERASAAVAEQCTALVTISVVEQFMGLLSSQNYYPQVLNRITSGHEQAWKQAVAKGLQHMQTELRIGDALQQYNSFCRVGRELFLRELRGKATRILAHKKRQVKKTSQ